MFADAFESMIYVTTNEGETFNSYAIPADPRTLKVHPTLSRWILGYDVVEVKCAVIIWMFVKTVITMMITLQPHIINSLADINIQADIHQPSKDQIL